ncbi:MDR family MFS transporter [Tumebacillus sp. DT12]|uniref:MDR family MFS transporter n=1 Tax=Tumebacillus lacus TaxID=2995335 RepID=A0ABT3X489_9BACL|nr:MDR family MFS transporter [Tumebacillus lacus]MCX7571256.1 MDR family MFS transporter [Tumebacillus lacus]
MAQSGTLTAKGMEDLDPRTKVTIMIAILAGMLFSALNQTIVGTALPRIIADLGGMEYYSWVFTSYMLTSSVTMLLAGKLSDMYGRKVFLLIGMAVFMVGAFLAGTAGTIIQLIVHRGIQGLGAGIIMTTSMAAVGDLFSPRERGKWQGVLGAVFGLASVIGPFLGGYIVDYFNWEWVFWVNLPIGVIAFFMILRLFPQTARQEGKIDYLGAVLVTVVIVTLLLAFSWAGSKYEWGSAQIVGLFVASAVSLLLFLLAESRATSPILPLGLFTNSIFNISNIVGFLTGFAMFGAIMYIPLFVQGVIGTSATQSGLVMMPMTVSLVIASALAGQLTTRTGRYKWVAIMGNAILVVGMYLLSTMTVDTANLTATFYMIILGAGLGFTMPIFMLAVQNALPPSLLGVTSSAVQLFRSVGGTVGVAIMGTIMTNKINEEMTAHLPGAVKQFLAQPGVAEQSKNLMNPQILINQDKLGEIRAAMPAQVQPIFDQLIEALKFALTSGLDAVFHFGFYIALVGLALTFLLKEIPLRTSNKEAADGADATKVNAEPQHQP